MAAGSNHAFQRAVSAASLFAGIALAGIAMPPAVLAILPAPNGLHATEDCDKITVSASPVNGAVAYALKIYVGDSFTALTDTVIQSLPYLDYPPPAQRRRYQVAGIDAQSQVGNFATTGGNDGRYGLAQPDPLPDRAQLVGRPITFTLNGAFPNGSTFTWRKNGSPIGAPSQSTYSIASVSLADSGDYSCEVVNICGTDSDAMRLFVANVPLRPSSVTAVAQCDTVNITWPTVAGAWAYLIDRNPHFPLPQEGPWPGRRIYTNSYVDHPGIADNYTYSVFTVVYDSLFSLTGRSSGSVTVSLGASIQNEPVDRTVESGTSINLSTSAQPSGPKTYTWRKDGQTVQTGGNSSLPILNAQPAQSGIYDCIVCNSCGCDTTRATLVRVCSTPAITVATSDRHVYANEGAPGATLTASVTPALSVRWYRDGAALADGADYSGTASPVLTILGVNSADEGYYELRAVGDCQTVVGPAIQLSVAPCYDPPVITQQPVGTQAVPIGQKATLSIQATCCHGPSYRWKRRVTGSVTFVDVPGGDQPTLSISPLTSGDLGTYVCFVANRDRYEVSQFSELGATIAPAFYKVAGWSMCNGWNVGWNTNVPAVVTLEYWPGSCDSGTPGTLPPSALATSGQFTLPLPAGQQYYVRLRAVTPGNETAVSGCMLAVAAPPGPRLTGSISILPYYVTMPFGTAVPIVVGVGNYGCSTFEGDIYLSTLTVAGVAGGALNAVGDPAAPDVLLPSQLVPSQARSFQTYYVPVTVPPPGVAVIHDLSSTVLYLPTGGSPTLLTVGAKMRITSEGPK